jgi:hypothetical protein
VHGFGVPYKVTVDNGKQFGSTDFKRFCFNLGTKICFASVYHPESNIALERANDIIFTGIIKNLRGMARRKWVKELPRVVWSHNTTTSRATNFTPFRLLYGEEAVIPKEVKLGSLRAYQEPQTEEDENLAIDTREEDRLQPLSNIEKYQDETRKWRNKKVCEQKISKRHIKTGREVGGSILHIRNKARGLQTANPGRRRGSLLMESAQVVEVLALRISVSSTRFHHFSVSLHFHLL